MKIKTYIINLKRRPDRKEQLIKLIPNNLDFQFTSDIGINYDGKKLNLESLPNVQLYDWEIESENRWWSRPLKFGEIGCSLAHFSVWELACSEKLDMVLILEDDVFFDTEFQLKLQFYLKILEQKTKWDLFYLGRTRRYPDKYFDDNIVIPGYSYCAFAYMLSKRGIKKILENNFLKNVIPVDEFLPSLYIDHPRADIRKLYPKSLEAYALNESIIFQKEKRIAGSDTEESNFVEKKSR